MVPPCAIVVMTLEISCVWSARTYSEGKSPSVENNSYLRCPTTCQRGELRVLSDPLPTLCECGEFLSNSLIVIVQKINLLRWNFIFLMVLTTRNMHMQRPTRICTARNVIRHASKRTYWWSNTSSTSSRSTRTHWLVTLDNSQTHDVTDVKILRLCNIHSVILTMCRLHKYRVRKTTPQKVAFYFLICYTGGFVITIFFFDIILEAQDFAVQLERTCIRIPWSSCATLTNEYQKDTTRRKSIHLRHDDNLTTS